MGAIFASVFVSLALPFGKNISQQHRVFLVHGYIFASSLSLSLSLSLVSIPHKDTSLVADDAYCKYTWIGILWLAAAFLDLEDILLYIYMTSQCIVCCHFISGHITYTPRPVIQYILAFKICHQI